MLLLDPVLAGLVLLVVVISAGFVVSLGLAMWLMTWGDHRCRRGEPPSADRRRGQPERDVAAVWVSRENQNPRETR